MSNLRLKKRSLSQEDLFNFSELFKLMKPRVMSLVIFTCAVGLLTAPNLVSTKDAIIGILLVFPITRKVILSKYSKKYSSKNKDDGGKKNYIDGEFEDIEDNDDRKI